MSAEVTTNGATSETDTKQLEEKFDDLLGISGDSGSSMKNRDVSVTQKETIVEGDTTTTIITETKTETVTDGASTIETKEVKEIHAPTVTENEESRETNEDRSSPVDRPAAADGVAGSPEPQQARTMDTSPKLEDNLPEYQPPKRAVKHEVKENRNATGVVIMREEKSNSENSVKNRISKFTLGGAGGGNICVVCQKRVYELEKMIANKDIYHKTCFRCMHCKRVLTLANFASLEGQLYCKPHFLEMFKTKGNYEEGFGRNKRTSAYTPQYKPDSPSNKTPNQDADSRPADIARADEKPDEHLENLPNIKNLKSRFESGDESAATPQSQKREVPNRFGGGHSESSPNREGYNGSGNDKTSEVESEVHFQEVHSVRNRFESSGPAPSPSAGQSRPPSKWDKPKDKPVPPPVNRGDDGDSSASELPPSGTSRNLVNKFREIETHDSGYQNEGRKPVRKITPPREELQKEIEMAGYHHDDTDGERKRDPNVIMSGNECVYEEELPPPSTTKNMLAKFKSMEDLLGKAPPPLPKPNTTPVKNQPKHGSSVDPKHGVNGHGREHKYSGGEIYHEGDSNNEKELPPSGTTQKNLALWRNKEGTAETDLPVPRSSHNNKVATRYDIEQEDFHTTQNFNGPFNDTDSETMTFGSADDMRARGDVVRESDTPTEDELPPPAYTKQMLNIFKNLETDSVDGKSPGAEKKKFKWEVKEPNVIIRGAPKQKGQYEEMKPDSDPVHVDNGVEPYGNHQEDYAEDYAETNRYQEEIKEDPVPANMTKNLLAKFRSMEDVSKAPPTPETAQKAQIARQVSQKNHVEYKTPEEREQPDGGEFDNCTHYDSLSESSSMVKFEMSQANGGEYENSPTRNADVVREEDDYETQNLPEEGTTRNLLAKFQQIAGTG